MCFALVFSLSACNIEIKNAESTELCNYLIKEYTNEIKNDIKIDSKNDDSLGAEFYEIDKLNKQDLSDIAILESNTATHPSSS